MCDVAFVSVALLTACRAEDCVDFGENCHPIQSGNGLSCNVYDARWVAAKIACSSFPCNFHHGQWYRAASQGWDGRDAGQKMGV